MSKDEFIPRAGRWSRPLSPQQQEQEARYHIAVKLLWANGFPAAEYRLQVVSNETEEPGCIYLR